MRFLLAAALLAQSKPTADEAAKLVALIGSSPRLAITAHPIAIQAPSPDWNTDYISSVAAGPDGLVYLLHRKAKYDPVVAVDSQGRIVRSWGKGLYTNPHSIRIDPQGNVWTVDSGSSVILKFTREGQ
ncbi:MAG: hypothetical protein FJW31_20200 [Acidobacteria bacterium]|nr:hypothetical protein [Acidobacteriota bacterium]